MRREASARSPETEQPPKAPKRAPAAKRKLKAVPNEPEPIEVMNKDIIETEEILDERDAKEIRIETADPQSMSDTAIHSEMLKLKAERDELSAVAKRTEPSARLRAKDAKAFREKAGKRSDALGARMEELAEAARKGSANPAQELLEPIDRRMQELSDELRQRRETREANDAEALAAAERAIMEPADQSAMSREDIQEELLRLESDLKRRISSRKKERYAKAADELESRASGRSGALGDRIAGLAKEERAKASKEQTSLDRLERRIGDLKAELEHREKVRTVKAAWENKDLERGFEERLQELPSTKDEMAPAAQEQEQHFPPFRKPSKLEVPEDDLAALGFDTIFIRGYQAALDRRAEKLTEIASAGFFKRFGLKRELRIINEEVGAMEEEIIGKRAEAARRERPANGG